MRAINIADLKDPADPKGRTYREINNSKAHVFEEGQLVEIDNGVRMFIAKQTRDCDGTPLYSLTPFKGEVGDDFFMRNRVHGFGEKGVRLIAQ